MLFRDRIDAGRQLAKKLTRYFGHSDVLVLALPRGGVPVAYPVAKALQAPLDVFLVRKLGLPGQEELAIGAIASGDVRVLNNDVVKALNIPPEIIDQVAQRELRELERRESAYRGNRPQQDVRDRIVILVDDGLATGSSMRAAITALRRWSPAKVIAAVPVASSKACTEIATVADEVVCLKTPKPFSAVGIWFDDFTQVSDEQVCTLLAQAQHDGMDRIDQSVDQERQNDFT